MWGQMFLYFATVLCALLISCGGKKQPQIGRILGRSYCHFSGEECSVELILMSLNLVIAEYLKLDFTSVRQKVVTLCEKLHENYLPWEKELIFQTYAQFLFLNVCGDLNRLHEQRIPRRLLVTLLLQSKFNSSFMLLGTQDNFRIAQCKRVSRGSWK